MCIHLQHKAPYTVVFNKCLLVVNEGEAGQRGGEPYIGVCRVQTPPASDLLSWGGTGASLHHGGFWKQTGLSSDLILALLTCS